MIASSAGNPAAAGGHHEERNGYSTGSVPSARAVNRPTKFLRGKAVELLRRLLTEAISSELAKGEEKELLEGGNDHNHG